VAWPELFESSLESLKGLSATRQKDSLELLQSLAAIEDCPASARAPGCCGSLGTRVSKQHTFTFFLFPTGEFNRLRIAEREIGFGSFASGRGALGRTWVKPGKGHADADSWSWVLIRLVST
jgi:hypothetical protein